MRWLSATLLSVVATSAHSSDYGWIDRPDWGSNFSEAGEPGREAPAAPPAEEERRDTKWQDLIEVNSLPVFLIRAGQDPGGPQPEAALAPVSPTTKTSVKIGDCMIELRTGAWTVTAWERQGKNLAPVTDSLRSGSELRAEDDGRVYLSLSTEVHVKPKTIEACQALQGRTVPLNVTLADTQVGVAGKHSPAVTKPGLELKTFLEFDGASESLLVSKLGVVASVYTGVYAVAVPSTGIFALEIIPSLALSQAAR